MSAVWERSKGSAAWVGILLLLGAGAGYYYLDLSYRTVESEASPVRIFHQMVDDSIVLPSVENQAFTAGEKLHYNVIYKGITVGHALIEVSPGPLVNERPTWQYVSSAKSTKFFDAFFKVRDKNVSTVDRRSLMSVAFDQNLREGRYRAMRQYTFDYKDKKFTSSEKRAKDAQARKKEGDLEAPLHDVLSSLYYVRTQNLTPGKNLSLSFFHKGTLKSLPIVVGAETKELDTALGKVSCIKVEPMIQGDSLFKSKDNKLTVWMTNDEKKVPVLMEAKISVGLVRVRLDQWEK